MSNTVPVWIGFPKRKEFSKQLSKAHLVLKATQNFKHYIFCWCKRGEIRWWRVANCFTEKKSHKPLKTQWTRRKINSVAPSQILTLSLLCDWSSYTRSDFPFVVKRVTGNASCMKSISYGIFQAKVAHWVSCWA